ncbi:MAG TPA: tRNA uridine-5-carboxymethylaminomethyl(34) synthesis GTPase MnmE, partial [Nitrospirota bacterium]|nr:tRNA uridine-5-carboxymethylaminomethyl(34) synthesis GTPase MnmE [Nitrospirota bacterium]
MPMSEPDTICAVSTPPGDGGIGIIRVSGRDAVEIASRLFRSTKNGDLRSAETHTIRYGSIIDPASEVTVDEALISVMRGPATYTREDVVEINCHGGTAPLMRTMELLITSGARQAEPGEFTKRAFLNGRIDLAQAEAVMDIIRARTDLSLRAANEQLRGGLSSEVGSLREQLTGILAGVEAGVDFPEEEIETPSGRPIAEEVRAVIAGIDTLLEGAIRGKVLRDGVAT